MNYCAICGKKIDWITSAEGKQVPVDPDPVFVLEGAGREAFLDDMGVTVIGRRATPEEEREIVTPTIGREAAKNIPYEIAFERHRATCDAKKCFWGW